VATRNRSAEWRKLAEEAKAIAARMQDGGSKQTMLKIAERYEALSRHTDQWRRIRKTALISGTRSWGPGQCHVAAWNATTIAKKFSEMDATA
jgi:hypothetical protein